MPGLAVVGTQWGDEGKGKFVDLLAPRFDAVVRFGGGHNAGHTVVVEGRTVVLHLLPSAVLHPGVRSIVGNGCVVDPLAFFEEVGTLEAAGLDPTADLLLSDRAHLILPVHREIEAREETRLGERQIGTTRRGIGPAYADKAARRGLRLGDLRHRSYRDERLAHLIGLHGEALDWSAGRTRREIAESAALLDRFAARVGPLLADTSLVIHRALEAGRQVLFEGAQAALLDLDFGTYPFVTSSTAVAGGAAVGAGVGPRAIGRVLGVAKAYQTRVGGGPFPTAMAPETNRRIQERGREFGASTGRPRRCGWFDSVVLRYARRVNGLDELAITKLDVLDGLDEVRIAVRYRLDGDPVEELPGDHGAIARCEPEYRTLPGWKRPTRGQTDPERLPAQARRYLDTLEELCQVPVTLVSTGPDRESCFARHETRILPPRAPGPERRGAC